MKCLKNVYLASTILALFIFATNSFAAPIKAVDKSKVTKVEKSNPETTDSNSSKTETSSGVIKQKQVANRFDPELGIMGVGGLPIGDASEVLHFGFGAKIDFSMLIPGVNFLKNSSYEIRPGAFTGFHLNSVKSSIKTGSFLTLPMVIFAEIDFLTIKGPFVPYFSLGTGITLASVASTNSFTSIQNSESSLDGTLYFAGGGKYSLGESKKFFLKMELAFYMIFEEVNGLFLQFNFGGGYRF